MTRMMARSAGIALLLLTMGTAASGGAIRSLPGISTVMPANDDGSAGPVALGFAANFYGATYAHVWVNNNGNVTFGSGNSEFIPHSLSSAWLPTIAPFWADVDTRGLGSGLTTYGTDTLDGRAAFGVTWPGVGYFPASTNQRNSFQLLIIDRSDTGAGNFDIEFNYDAIGWETGGNGFGGTSAFAGIGPGYGQRGRAIQLPGSGLPGAFLDGGPRSLIAHSNNGVPGRYLFESRSGSFAETPEPATLLLLSSGLCGLGWWRMRARS